PAGPGGSVLRLADLQDAPDMNAKRKAIWYGALGAAALYIILMLGPAIGGRITAEHPATAPTAAK
ncbi:hypothetical protein, partial [Pseudomonas aeruginosa]|uniref:hypothetical protein n=1 Tax=Pseudomonas aeruginosa TaxID=287 RepID=UPI001C8C03CF